MDSFDFDGSAAFQVWTLFFIFSFWSRSFHEAFLVDHTLRPVAERPCSLSRASCQDYLCRVDFDPNDHGMLQKLKRKWYAKNVDSSATSGNAAPQHTRSNPSAPPPSPNPTPQSSTRAPATRVATINKTIMGLQAATVVLGVLSVMGYVIGGLDFALRAAFICQVVMWAAMLYRDLGSRFSFSTAFAEIAFQNDASHYCVYAFMFAASYQGLLPLLPLAIYSFFNCVRPLGQMYPAYLGKLAAWAGPIQPRAMALAVQVEVLLEPYLVLMIFLGGSFIAPFGHYQFLKFRYMFSAHTRYLIDSYVGRIDVFVNSRIPAVAPYYNKVRGWLALPRQP